MTNYAAFFWMTATAAIIAVVIIAFLHFLLKHKALSSGKLDENYVKLLQQPIEPGSALKWGILLFFSGMGLVVLHFIPIKADSSPIPWGVEMIFIAAGFICYYLIMKKRG